MASYDSSTVDWDTKVFLKGRHLTMPLLLQQPSFFYVHDDGDLLICVVFCVFEVLKRPRSLFHFPRFLPFGESHIRPVLSFRSYCFHPRGLFPTRSLHRESDYASCVMLISIVSPESSVMARNLQLSLASS